MNYATTESSLIVIGSINSIISYLDSLPLHMTLLDFIKENLH